LAARLSPMKTLKALLMTAALVMSMGCTRRLLIQNDDSPPLVAAKVAGRIPLAIVSLGMSEVMASCVNNTARRYGYDTLPDSPAWDICNGRMIAAGGAAAATQAAQPQYVSPPQSQSCVRVCHDENVCTAVNGCRWVTFCGCQP